MRQSCCTITWGYNVKPIEAKARVSHAPNSVEEMAATAEQAIAEMTPAEQTIYYDGALDK